MSEWISVKDQLPSLEEEVLAWDGEHIEKAFRTEVSLMSCPNVSWYWTYYDYTDWEGVTHWMRLPEAPHE